MTNRIVVPRVTLHAAVELPQIGKAMRLPPPFRSVRSGIQPSSASPNMPNSIAVFA